MLTVAPQVQPDTVRGTAPIGVATVVAAWPAGVSPLAQAVGACQRRDTCDVEWLARVPNSIMLSSAF